MQLLGDFQGKKESYVRNWLIIDVLTRNSVKGDFMRGLAKANCILIFHIWGAYEEKS
jgi:hypothetical protein